MTVRDEVGVVAGIVDVVLVVSERRARQVDLVLDIAL